MPTELIILLALTIGAFVVALLYLIADALTDILIELKNLNKKGK
jgi:hypothetical protein